MSDLRAQFFSEADPTPGDDPSKGWQLGSYTVLDELGRGGMATVYLAEQPSMHRQVAIKVLPRQFTHDPQFIARFNREVALIAGLEHPHILPVYDFGTDEDVPYIVMRYLGGGSLRDWLKRGAVSLEDLARPIRQIGEALDFAHQQGIIHRDLKPDNILMDDAGNAYLADFGIAQVVTEAGRLTGSIVVGTPAYMAPEQVQGHALDARTDVYALGIMLFEMVTGQEPFDASTPMALLVKHITEPMPSPRAYRPDLPASVEAVILQATSKKASGRYPSAGKFAQAYLDALAQKRGAPVPESSPADDAPVTVMDTDPPPKKYPTTKISAGPPSPPGYPADQGYDVAQAISDYYDAFDAHDWQTAERLLAEIKDSGLAPQAFDIEAETAKLAAHQNREAADQQRQQQEAAAAEAYGAVQKMAQRNPKVALRGLQKLWRLHGTYDPDVLAVRLRPLAAASDQQQRLVQQLFDARLMPEVRASTGRSLAKAGDPRRGVGQDSSGQPRFDWVEIPAGHFWFGEGDTAALIALPAFFIARYPVTVAQYAPFVAAQRRSRRVQPPLHWEEDQWHIDNHPVVGVSWYDAVAYAEWLNETLSPRAGTIRIPTEQQWEKAARFTDGRAYPWGPNYLAGYANVVEAPGGKTTARALGRTTAAGIYPQGASVYGVLDMSGNVCEWCLNEFENPQNIQAGYGMRRTARGGAWQFDQRGATTTHRFSFDPDRRHPAVGLRVVLVRG